MTSFNRDIAPLFTPRPWAIVQFKVGASPGSEQARQQQVNCHLRVTLPHKYFMSSLLVISVHRVRSSPSMPVHSQISSIHGGTKDYQSLSLLF